MEEFVMIRIGDRADVRFAVHQQSDGDAPVVQAVDEAAVPSMGSMTQTQRALRPAEPLSSPRKPSSENVRRAARE